MTATVPLDRRAPRATTLRDEWRFFRGHVNPRIQATALAVTLTARLAVGDWGAGDAIVAAAMLAAQPFFEWTFHVYVLHYRPITVFGRTIDFELARKHREHHADPTDVALIFVPLRSMLIAMGVSTVVAFVALPTLQASLTALALGSALLLAYEWSHYLVHSRYRPKTRLFKAICRAHRLHHYKNEQYWFGVTNHTADRVLRTYPDAGDVPTSPTARDLGAR
ncbi:MAG TPA: sterol desaturase family protein [Egibacteraceae bacterium]|nr:sterol desaturase family protein [Egibacteraceae bacterium]